MATPGANAVTSLWGNSVMRQTQMPSARTQNSRLSHLLTLGAQSSGIPPAPNRGLSCHFSLAYSGSATTGRRPASSVSIKCTLPGGHAATHCALILTRRATRPPAPLRYRATVIATAGERQGRRLRTRRIRPVLHRPAVHAPRHRYRPSRGIRRFDRVRVRRWPVRRRRSVPRQHRRRSGGAMRHAGSSGRNSLDRFAHSPR